MLVYIYLRLVLSKTLRFIFGSYSIRWVIEMWNSIDFNQIQLCSNVVQCERITIYYDCNKFGHVYCITEHLRAKRHRSDVDTEENLKKLILKVGDKVSCYSLFTTDVMTILTRLLTLLLQSTASLESNLEGLATVLESSMTNHKGFIIKVLCDM